MIIHGDAREVLPTLDLDPATTVVITDPPWPGCEHVPIDGADRALELWSEVAPMLPRIASRLVLWLGHNTDPRGMLDAVPRELPFLTLAWLRFVPPGYRGCVMASADLAYVFGRARIPEGARVLPSEAISNGPEHARERGRLQHPCPRSPAHARWLVRWYAAKATTIVDPFCGSGTTLVAAAELGLDYIGIDSDARWIEEARARVEAAEAQQLITFEASTPPAITTTQRETLVVFAQLARERTPTIRELAQARGVTSYAIHCAVKVLIRKGMLAKAATLSRGLSLTDIGRAALEASP